MNKPLNVGLIGCGRAAERLYLPALSHLLAEGQLVAVADPIRERRAFISSGIPGCLAFESAEELFRKSRINAVIISTPPETHIEMAKLALRAGIPALVEKPLATSMAGIKELEALVASSRGSLMVGFNRRFWKPVRQLRQRMRNLNHFDTVMAEMIMKTDIQAWSPICGVVSHLDDLGSHQFDLLRFIFDSEITAISASLTDKHVIQMHVRLACGASAECLTAHSNIYQESITVLNEEQKYMIHMGSERIQPAAGFYRSILDLYDTFRRLFHGQRSSLFRSYELQLISFFNGIQTGTTPQPGIVDGIAAIRAVEAVRKSIASEGKEVLLS